MKVFLDTNVLLDVLEERKPHYDSSSQIWSLVEADELRGFISAISFDNIYYLINKHANQKLARRAIKIIHATFTMVNLDHSVMEKAIDSEMPDFEDSIQYFSAAAAKVDFLLTRNAKDFPRGNLPTLSPENFLTQWMR